MRKYLAEADSKPATLQTGSAQTASPKSPTDPQTGSSTGGPASLCEPVGGRGRSFSVAELVDAGVKRISFAAAFYRAAMTGLFNAATEVRDQGTFGYIDSSLATPEMNAFLRE